MKKNLNVLVVNKIAKYLQRGGAIVCGNSDYQITFAFDAEWDEYENKTARFVWNGQHWDQPFEGNVCPVPIINDTLLVTVGVYAGDLSTTTPADIPCKRSILCGNTKLSEGSVEGLRDQAVNAAQSAVSAAYRAEQAAKRAEDCDPAEAIESAISAIAKYEQLKPEFAQSAEWLKDPANNADTSKLYVLPEGDIWAYMMTTTVISGVKTDYAKLLAAEWETDTRLTTSSKETGVTGVYTTPYIPCSYGQTIRIKGLDVRTTPANGNARYHIYGSEKNNKIVSDAGYTANLFNQGQASIDGDVISITAGMIAAGSGSKTEEVGHQRFCGVLMEGYTLNDVVITVDEPIVEGEVVTGYHWADTGLDFVPNDSADEIYDLTKRTTTLEISQLDHEERLKNIETSTGETTDIPEYWKTELETKADAIQRAMETAGRNKSAFLWYTDAHWYSGNTGKSPKLLNYLYMNTSMNKVNFGGDIIGSTLFEDRDETSKHLREWRSAIKNLPNHHSVIGNHDAFSSYSYATDNYRYAFMFAPEETPDIVWGDGDYYYIDNHHEKTRYLYMCFPNGVEEDQDAQGAFIVDALKTTPEGWHIVAIAHRWWQYKESKIPRVGDVPQFESQALSVFEAYNKREVRPRVDEKYSDYFKKQDFSTGNAKGRVEFCIGGHIHIDYDLEWKNGKCVEITAEGGGIPIILTASDVNQPSRVTDDIEDGGDLGSIRESAVYGIIADYNLKKVTVVGVGRGNLDYETGIREVNLLP